MTAEALRKWLESKGYDYEDLKNKFNGDKQQSRIKDFLRRDGLSKGRSNLQIEKSTIYAIDEAYKQDVIDEIAQRNEDYKYHISITIKNAGDINTINQITINEEYEKETINYLKENADKEIAQRNEDYRSNTSTQIKNAGDINTINQITINEEYGYEKENVDYLKRYLGKRESDFERRERYLEEAKALTRETLDEYGLTSRSTAKTIAKRFGISIEEAEEVYNQLR